MLLAQTFRAPIFFKGTYRTGLNFDFLSSSIAFCSVALKGILEAIFADLLCGIVPKLVSGG